jgi:hypothetical protein
MTAQAINALCPSLQQEIHLLQTIANKIHLLVHKYDCHARLCPGFYEGVFD